MNTVYDFSGAHLTDLPGAIGAMLYMGTPGRPKNATPAQVAALLANGYQVGGVYENNTFDWSRGRIGGQAFARSFDTDATACGLPGLPGAFTADLPAADPIQFIEMLRGANDVIGVARTTAYGFLPHLIAARNAGVASRFWLCGHCPNPMPPWVNLYQHNGSQPAEWGPATSTVGGITVDHNTVLLPDWGQFGGDMLTPADVDAIAARIFDAQLTPPGSQPGKTRTVRELLEDIQGYGVRTEDIETNLLPALGKQVGGLATAVDKLGARPATGPTAAEVATEIIRQLRA